MIHSELKFGLQLTDKPNRLQCEFNKALHKIKAENKFIVPNDIWEQFNLASHHEAAYVLYDLFGLNRIGLFSQVESILIKSMPEDLLDIMVVETKIPAFKLAMAAISKIQSNNKQRVLCEKMGLVLIMEAIIYHHLSEKKPSIRSNQLLDYIIAFIGSFDMQEEFEQLVNRIYITHEMAKQQHYKTAIYLNHQ